MAKPIPVSPLMVPLPPLPVVRGVKLGAAAAGLRYQGRPDVMMMEFAPGTTVAGVFTQNKCPGAPVDWCRTALKGGKARAKNMTKEERSESARKAANARWAKKRQQDQSS